MMKLTQEYPYHISKLLTQTLTNELRCNAALKALLQYSLIDRLNNDVSIHPLVQMVTRDFLSIKQQENWTQSLAKLFHWGFPKNPQNLKELGDARRLSPQVEKVAQEAKKNRTLSSLLTNLAVYYFNIASYSNGQKLIEQTIAIDEKLFGEGHPNVAFDFILLAEFSRAQGKYEDAEFFHYISFGMMQKASTFHMLFHANTFIFCTHSLASLYLQQGKYEEAEMFYCIALEIIRRGGFRHPWAITCLNSLALLFSQQENYEEAAPLFRKAIELSREETSNKHSNMTLFLSNVVATSSSEITHYDEEPLYSKALELSKKESTNRSYETAIILNNVAHFSLQQEKYEEAEPLFFKALEISENLLGNEHPNIAILITNIAVIYARQRKYKQAEKFYSRAIEIWKELEYEDFNSAVCYSNFAFILTQQEKYEEAEQMYRKALKIIEETLDPQHPAIAICLYRLSMVVEANGKTEDAHDLQLKHLIALENSLSSEYRELLTGGNNLERFL